MRILFVIDDYRENANNIAKNALKMATTLEEGGHTVEIVCGSHSKEGPVHSTGQKKISFLSLLMRPLGIRPATVWKKTVKESVRTSDIVHIFLPFRLGKKAKRYAKRYNIPATAGFYLQPEELANALKLSRIRLIDYFLYGFWRRFYNKFEIIHCPSMMIEQMITSHGYKAGTYVIPTGHQTEKADHDHDKPPVHRGKFLILMMGMSIKDKSVGLLLDAVRLSEHEAEIQIIVAGKATPKKKLMKKGRYLTNSPEFETFSDSELEKVAGYSDLYVHTADADPFATECIEAFATGLVPIISNSVHSAAGKYALSDESLFEAGDPNDLKSRIDFLIENPDIKKSLAESYLEYAETFSKKRTLKRFERFFKSALRHQNKDS